MLKRTLFLLASVTLVVSLQAQNKSEVAQKAPLKVEPATETVSSQAHLTGSVPTFGPSALNWVVVDTMGNCYGPAIGALNPLAFDPWTNTVIIAHRGGGTSPATLGGKIYYNYSTDKGATWARGEQAFNESNSAYNGRYPSMTFNNPTHGNNIENVLIGASWPELVNGAFGGVGAGADEYPGAGFTVSSIYVNADSSILYSSQVPTFASDTEAFTFWASDNGTDAAIHLWRTSDFTGADFYTPETWNSAKFQDNGNITLGGAAQGGNLYYAVIGSFEMQNAPQSGWIPGYSKSTDNGVTWSDWSLADWRNVPALSKYDRLFDYIKGDTYISYVGDMNVDKDGNPHLLFCVTDTIGDNNSGTNALIEMYEVNGTWTGKVVYEGIGDSSYTHLRGPGLGQVGPAAFLSFDKDKNVVAATWNMPRTLTDSLVDVYGSYRVLPDGDWSTPVNLTDSPGMNENANHAAPYLQTNGDGSYTAYVFINYPLGYDGYFPNGAGYETQPTGVYVGAWTFTPPTGINDPAGTPSEFVLSQNYPNPFNPTTAIKFSVPERSDVSLKVFDMLGREVATLVNEVKEAGSYELNFDASALASGTYIYKLTAGNNVQTKKMVLLK